MRLQSLAESGPALDEQKLDQIAALPLGSRIRLDPWTNHISLLQAKPVSLLSARDKLPFEITPFMLPLSRVEPQPAPSRTKRSTTAAAVSFGFSRLSWGWNRSCSLLSRLQNSQLLTSLQRQSAVRKRNFIGEGRCQ